MSLRIEQDHNRFKQIVRGRIKKNLREYIGRGELIGRKGRDLVSIPIPQIDLPRFVHGPRQSGGVGQGEGDVGQVLGAGDSGDGAGQAGNAPGQHILEVEVSLEELARILGEELELPAIKRKGRKNIVSEKDRYVGISSSGPESLRHFKRTYKEALKRQIASGTYDPMSPRIVPIRRDRRYRTWKVHREPETNAVIIYMMDVSGSMGDDQKEIVRIESFWIDTWLRSQYDGIEVRYVIHDAEAREVDRETFYHTRESGGTVISSAYRLAEAIIDREFSPEEWNIYLFHFSDGDNWGGDDTRKCIQLLETDLIPKANLFCYGQVKSAYGSGQFIKDLRGHFKDSDAIILSEIGSRDEIYDSIKAFLGKGR